MRKKLFFSGKSAAHWRKVNLSINLKREIHEVIFSLERNEEKRL